MVGSEDSPSAEKNTQPVQDARQQYIIRQQTFAGSLPPRDGLLELTGRNMCRCCQEAGRGACHIGSKPSCLACHDSGKQCLFERDIRVVGPSFALPYDVLQGLSSQLQNLSFEIEVFTQNTNEMRLSNSHELSPTASGHNSTSNASSSVPVTSQRPIHVPLSNQYESSHYGTGAHNVMSSSSSISKPQKPLRKDGTPSRSLRDVRVHECGICHEVFTRNEHLTRHQRRHTGELPFNCNICGRSFPRQDSRNAHQAKAHPEDPPTPSTSAPTSTYSTVPLTTSVYQPLISSPASVVAYTTAPPTTMATYQPVAMVASSSSTSTVPIGYFPESKYKNSRQKKAPTRQA